MGGRAVSAQLFRIFGISICYWGFKSIEGGVMVTLFRKEQEEVWRGRPVWWSKQEIFAWYTSNYRCCDISDRYCHLWCYSSHMRWLFSVTYFGLADLYSGKGRVATIVESFNAFSLGGGLFQKLIFLFLRVVVAWGLCTINFKRKNLWVREEKY